MLEQSPALGAISEHVAQIEEARGVPDLICLVRQLAEIAESNLPPADKLSLLCTQIGTALFWVEQIRSRSAESRAALPQGPHYLSLSASDVGPRARSDVQIQRAP